MDKSDLLTTRLTSGKLVHFVLPKDTNAMDFKLLERWLNQLEEATFYGCNDDTAAFIWIDGLDS